MKIQFKQKLSTNGSLLSEHVETEVCSEEWNVQKTERRRKLYWRLL